MNSNADLLAWGYNTDGRLGIGSNNHRNIPTSVFCANLSAENFSQSRSFILYPNPASDVISIINYENNTIEKITLFDTVGKKIKEQTGNTTQINIHELQNGMYIVHIVSEKQNHILKFVKR